MRGSRRICKRWLCSLLALTLLVQSISCGTILYPERVGQTRGALDYKVVALDTIGLLLFVVPGAIAFAVDFYNGTIFLPEIFPWAVSRYGGDFRLGIHSVASRCRFSRKTPTVPESRNRTFNYIGA